MGLPWVYATDRALRTGDLAAKQLAHQLAPMISACPAANLQYTAICNLSDLGDCNESPEPSSQRFKLWPFGEPKTATVRRYSAAPMYAPAFLPR